MKIGIDIDEVVTDTFSEVLKFHNLKKGTSFKKEEMHDYRMWASFPCTREEIEKSLSEMISEGHIEKYLPIEESLESINLLRKNHELFFITARPENHKEQTFNWFDKNIPSLRDKIFFSEDHFNGKGNAKFKICQEKDIKIMLEDSPNDALQCAQIGIKVILFDKPWNKSISHRNITRVSGWKEALGVIDSIKKKQNRIYLAL